MVALAAVAAAPRDALAHARLVRSEPRDGAVVATAPASVRLVFDKPVQPLGGTRAIRNGDGSVLAGEPRRAPGLATVLVVPLRSRLRNGDYTVAWRAVSDDGHTVTGVLAFGVGAGRAPPTPALSAASERPGAVAIVSRSLFFLGLLTALGAAVFDAFVWRPALARAGVEAEPGHLLALVFAGFVLALLGTVGLAPHHAAAATRADRLYAVGSAFAALGAMFTAIRYAEPRLRLAPIVVALALLPVPSLAGHASGAPAVALSTLADVVHLGAASVWVGGVLALALAVPAAGRAIDPERRATFQREAVRRFSTFALASVAVIAATGAARAVGELASVDQVWSTGYGRALVVKTTLLAALVGLGWRNRSRLIPRLEAGGGFGALLRATRTEAALLGGIVVAVAVLTALPPGRELPGGSAAAAAAPASTTVRLPPPPPAGALVLAREAGDLAVGVALRPARGKVAVQTSVLGPSGSAVDGLRVDVTAQDPVASSTATARRCGPGCYEATLPSTRPRSVELRLQGGGRAPAELRFGLPPRWPAPEAERALRRATTAFRGLRSLRIRERLASSPTNVLRTTYDIAAPNRLRYRIAGDGEAVLIGDRRWDRNRGGRWQAEPQSPIRQPTPTWGPRSAHAHLLRRDRATEVLSFFDPAIPAWFTLTVDRATFRPRDLRMTAAAHFMHHTYTRLDRPVSIQPPK